MDDAETTSFRPMGQILVDRRFITDDQLAEALSIQQQTGRLLGEICVERWDLDRVALAGALGEQWEEIDHSPARQPSPSANPTLTASGLTELDELRAQLAETELARVELASRTDELERRLALLEMLVTGLATQPQSFAR